MADMGGMSADTSSYLKPSEVARDPLDQILKLNQVMGQGELAKGLQQAIQPDGSIDRSVLGQVLSRTQAGALQAPAAMDAAEKLRQAGYQADAAGMQNFQTRMEHIGKAASFIVENPNKEGVMRGFGYLLNPNNGAAKVGLGIPAIQEAQKEYYDARGVILPEAQVKAIAQRQMTQALASHEAIASHLQQTGTMDTGQREVTVNKGTQFNPAYPSVQKEIPPTTVQPNAKNQPSLRGTQPSSVGSDVQYQAPPDITKRIIGYQGQPTSNGAPIKLAQPGDGTSYGTPRGGAAEPPPGFSTATEATARNSAQIASDIQTMANEAPQTKAIIGNLEKEAKNFTSGPLADYKRIGKSFALSNLPIPESLKKPGAMFDPESVADQESFNKNVYNLVQSQFRALGGTGTDSKLESASHTSPSEFMSQVGVKNILSLLKGNEDAKLAKAKAWNDWLKAGNGPQTAPDFIQQWNQNFDPRVYQFKYMTPAQRQDYYNKVDNADERRELKRRIEYAIDNKLVKY